MIVVPSAAIHQRGAVRKKIAEHATIATVALHFARRDTAPWACQSRIIGPKTRCVCSQWCKRVEPRAAAQAASSTKGVVGNPGTTMPITPRASAIHASNR